MSILFSINNEPDDILSEKHICFFTREGFGERVAGIDLYEVLEVQYRHPEAPTEASVQVVETRFISSHHRMSPHAANLVLLEAANKALSSRSHIKK